MATTNNPLLQGLNGAVGPLLFRNVQGKTVVSTYRSELSRSQKKKQSTLQRLNRDRFRKASCHARAMMLNPEMKAYYWQKAKKLKLPNAYTAAITDFMRKSSIQYINTKRYSGKAGGSISITANKKDFTVAEVSVTLTSGTGEVIEKGTATRASTGEWIYRNVASIAAPEAVTITVEAKGGAGNRTIGRVTGKGTVQCQYWRSGWSEYR